MQTFLRFRKPGLGRRIWESGRKGRLPTPLTRDNSSASQDERRIGERPLAAHSRLQELRSTGDAPTSRPDIRAKIGRNNRTRQLAIQEWEKRNGRSWDVEVFRREILPRLQGVTVAKTATATGLSIQYCSRVRRTLNVPHPLHWQALAGLVGVSSDGKGSTW